MIKHNINFKRLIFYSFTLLLFIFILFQIRHITLAEDKTILKQNNKNIYIDNNLKQKHISYIYIKINLDIDSINNNSISNYNLENIDIPINTENNTTINDTQNISSSTNTTTSINDNVSNNDDDTNINEINDNIKIENTENIEDNLSNDYNENNITKTTNDTNNDDNDEENIDENTKDKEKPVSINNTVSSDVNKKEIKSNNKVESSNEVVNNNSKSSTKTENIESNKDDENKQVKDTVFYTDEYYNDYFYAKGKVREENMIAAQETLNKIPQYILDNFKKDGWVINIINEDIVYNGLNASGITTYADKTIDIKNNEGLIRSCIVHEVGHYFDCSLGFISESDEFLNNIYPEEKNNFNYTYTTSIKHEISDVYEYFASTFDEYIINPNGLKNDCPKTYEFMKNLIG